jgi:hypothetical protein
MRALWSRVAGWWSGRPAATPADQEGLEEEDQLIASGQLQHDFGVLIARRSR